MQSWLLVLQPLDMCCRETRQSNLKLSTGSHPWLSLSSGICEINFFLLCRMKRCWWHFCTPAFYSMAAQTANSICRLKKWRLTNTQIYLKLKKPSHVFRANTPHLSSLPVRSEPSTWVPSHHPRWEWTKWLPNTNRFQMFWITLYITL